MYAQLSVVIALIIEKGLIQFSSSYDDFRKSYIDPRTCDLKKNKDNQRFNDLLIVSFFSFKSRIYSLI